MEYNASGIFSSMPTAEQYETQAEQIAALQTQLTALKRDLEYALYNIEFGNLSRRLQKRITDLEEGGS